MNATSRLSPLSRFLILTGLRWLPVGLLIPVLVLLPLSRGLSLAALGMAASMQGWVVFALELPTGGLADAAGRRRVTLAATGIGAISTLLFLVAHSMAGFAVAFAVQGVYRALDSGPLEAWFVDTVRRRDPDASIDGGIAAQGVVTGLGIATGAIAGGALVAVHPVAAIAPLATPVVAALGFQVLALAAVGVLMVEHPARAQVALRVGALARDAGRTVAEGVGLLRGSRVLLALVAVEVSWGFGMVCFEALMPVRLAELVGGEAAAAAVTGPAASAAWIASAVGAAATPWLSRRLGVAPVAALTRLAQGAAVAAMGLAAGAPGLLTAYLACYAVHGGANAAHATLLHQQATERVRATVLSMNSMVGQPAGALGALVLTALAGAAGTPVAMYVGAVVLAVAAPLYLPAWRQARRDGRPDLTGGHARG